MKGKHYQLVHAFVRLKWKSTELPSPTVEKKSTISASILNASVHKPTQPNSDQSNEKQLRPAKAPGRYSPAVVALASEHNIDLSRVEGTGMANRITRKDVQAFIASSVNGATSMPIEQASTFISTPPRIDGAASDVKPAMVSATGDIEIPVTPVRRTIAKNMLRSTLEVPHAWMMVEVDVTDLVNYRNSIKEDFKRREGYNLTYFAFFVKAVAQALKEYPMMNSMWAEDKIIQKKDINLSIAVATDDALFVPVIKHVDEKSIKGVAKEIFELSQFARTGKLKQEHMQGGTFTVNNTGSFGSIQSMGIINYPQAAILQVENIVKRPVVVQRDFIAPRHIVNLCLSLDHRVLDGLICGKFLNRVKEILENVNKQTTTVY